MKYLKQISKASLFYGIISRDMILYRQYPKLLLTAEEINKMAHEADQYIHLSHFSEDSHNVFFQDDDEFLPANHPLRIKEKTSLNSIPYDLMDPKDALHQLYN